MGVGALGAELCHDEVAKGHRASDISGGIFCTQPPNTHNVFVLCRQLLPRVDKSLVFIWPMGVIGAVP